MSASAGDVAQLRRMAAEATDANGYTDAVLSATIERHPIPDVNGLRPDADGWTPTYDLNGAAAAVWQEKAATLAAAFDFSADGASYQRSQAAAQALKLASYYRARRAASSRRLAAEVGPDRRAVIDG